MAGSKHATSKDRPTRERSGRGSSDRGSSDREPSGRVRVSTSATAQAGARERILRAATHLFAQKGLDGTSLQDIAVEVGMRKPSLLWHFASKDELHRAVLDALLSRWNEALPALLRAATREDRLDAVLDETIAFFAEDPDRARLLLREALDRPDAMRALLTEHATPWMAVVTDAITRGKQAGALREDVDPEAYVVMVIHLVIGNVATAGTVSMLAGGRGASGQKLPPRIASEIKRVARAALMAD